MIKIKSTYVGNNMKKIIVPVNTPLNEDLDKSINSHFVGLGLASYKIRKILFNDDNIELYYEMSYSL